MASHGFVFGILLASLPLTFLVSLWLLRRYRRRLARYMQQDSGYRPAPELELVPSLARERPRLSVIEHAPTGGKAANRRPQRGRIRLSLVYLLTGGLYALAYTYFYLRTGEMELLPVRFLVLFFTFAFPALLLVTQIWIRKPWLQAGLLLLVYGLLFPLTLPNITLAAFAFILFWHIGMPYVFYGLVRFRKYRAIGPFVWALLYGLLTTLALSLNIMYQAGTLVPQLGAAGLVLTGLGTLIVYVLLARLLLRRAVKRYGQKRSSDWIIQADIVFLLFGIWHINLLYLNRPEAGLWALGLLAGYKLLQVLLLRIWPQAGGEGQGLLLLRVFGYRSRSERLLDQHLFSWRFQGPIHMIAGTDLAAETIEPHEFLAFLGGNLQSLYVKNNAELEQQIQALDETPDPDGRYRINDFFCFDNVWKEALRTLLDRSDYVLMDLRGFTPHNRGCIYEIEQLLERVPLPRLAFLTDETTDLPFLKTTLEKVWSALPPESPNLRLPKPAVRLFSKPESIALGG